MTETKKSKKLTNDQLQTILNTEHIRQHLIKVGLINHRGEIIPKDGHRRRSRRRYNSNKNSDNKRKYLTSARRPLITADLRQPVETNINSKRQEKFRSPDCNSNERSLKSTSTAQPKQINTTQSATRFSSSNQSTCVQNVLLRRAVSPKIIPAGDRCLITMMYFGSETTIEYDREWLEPDGDEIVVMQQHCGGENLLVFKGSLKVNETFLFESRRHADFPFALAVYINGVIDNRLSICCESRCKNFMRIGGKRGLFAITKVEKSKPCRRCRFEGRMKKLTESEVKSSTNVGQHHPQKSSVAPTNSSKKGVARTKSPESTSTSTTNSKSTTGRKLSPEPTAAHVSSPKPSVARTPSPKQTEARISSPKPTEDHTWSHKRPATRTLSPELSISDTSSLEPSATKTMKSKERHESSPPLKIGSSTSNHQPRATSSPNQYTPDFEEVEERIDSTVSTPRENGQIEVPSSDTSEVNINNQRRPSIVSTEKDSDEEVVTITDESTEDFAHTHPRRNRRSIDE